MSANPRENKLSKYATPTDLEQIPGLSDILESEKKSARTHARTPALTQGNEEPEPLALVGLSVRVQPQTYKALQRAMREQKRKGKVPMSRQAIVEVAIVEWLKTEGYL